MVIDMAKVNSQLSLSLEVSNILFKYEGALSAVTVVVEASSYFLSSIMKAFVKIKSRRSFEGQIGRDDRRSL